TQGQHRRTGQPRRAPLADWRRRSGAFRPGWRWAGREDSRPVRRHTGCGRWTGACRDRERSSLHHRGGGGVSRRERFGRPAQAYARRCVRAGDGGLDRMNSFVLPAATLWQRELVRFWRQKSRVLGVVASPLVFWLLIGYGSNDLARFYAGSLVLTV